MIDAIQYYMYDQPNPYSRGVAMKTIDRIVEYLKSLGVKAEKVYKPPREKTE